MTRAHRRYVIVILCAFAMFLEFATRTNINNAIVSMTTEVIVDKSVIASDYCPGRQISKPFNATEYRNKGNVQRMAVTYDWSPTTQGLILGAFYYGYVMLQVPSGRLSEMFGGKLIVTIGLTASGLITLSTPWITDSVPLLTASRVLLGLVQGVVFPACFSINANWMSAQERSFGFGLINVGGNLGAVFASAVTGFVSQNYGWPYSFIGLGVFTVIWTMSFWLCFVRSHPDPDEMGILSAGSSMNGSTGSIKSMAGSSCSSTSDICLKQASSPQKPAPAVPWIKILSNKAVLSAAMSRFCGAFGYLTLATKLPAYLEDVLHESAAQVSLFFNNNRAIYTLFCDQNGMFNSFLFLATSVTMAFGPYLSEIVISKRWLSRTNTRKVFTGTG